LKELGLSSPLPIIARSLENLENVNVKIFNGQVPRTSERLIVTSLGHLKVRGILLVQIKNCCNVIKIKDFMGQVWYKRLIFHQIDTTITIREGV
jgi:hypothetical protein